MIKTGLPYSNTDMEKVYSEGAIVDMSSIKFPNIEEKDNARTSIIYLRNTNYKTELDFSNCSYEFKSQILKEYYLGDILYNIPELTETLLSILLIMNKITVVNVNTTQKMLSSLNCIFTDEETARFLKEEEIFLKNINQFLHSIPLYIYSRLATKEKVSLELNMFPKTDSIPCNKNIIHILKLPLVNEIVDGENPIFYENIFTINETELFEACKDLVFFHTIEFMLESTKEQVKELMDKADEFYKETKKELLNS